MINEYIRGKAQVEEFGDNVSETRLRQFGHVQRRESGYVGGKKKTSDDVHGCGQGGYAEVPARHKRALGIEEEEEEAFLCNVPKLFLSSQKSCYISMLECTSGTCWCY